MIDIRYHTVAIVAIFAMLGLGILIGEKFAAPAQVNQQSRTLAALSEQVGRAVQDGDEAKRRLIHVDHAVDTLRGRLVNAKLAGKRVEIIQYGEYPLASVAAADAVRDAGATVTATVVITDTLTTLPAADQSAMLGKANAPPSTVQGRGGLQNGSDNSSLIDLLMAELHSGTMPPDVVAPGLAPVNTASGPKTTISSMLEDQRCITVTGDIKQGCNLYVLVGGRNEDADPPAGLVSDTESAIIRGLFKADTNNTISIVGVEPVDASVSSIPTYQREQIATVDCIDLPLGQLDLPFALRGAGDKVDYGVKSTATRELPPSFEEQTHP